MVGYDPTSSKPELSRIGYGMAGALSGAMTRGISQPLDVLKIRFQLQVEPITKSSVSKYHGMFQACAAIYREEGIKAFWKGHIPAQYLSVVFGVVQFTTFELLTKKMWHVLPSYFTTELQPLTHFVCGSSAGCVSMATAQPFDVLRTRFVAQGEPKMYTSLLQAARSMFRLEGVRSFYKGLTPAMLQIAPQTGLQFGFYSMYTRVWKMVFGKRESGFASLQSLCCGSAAGLCAKLSIYPLDMAKKRLQVQGFAEGRKQMGCTDSYRGLFHCLKTVTHQEGLRGLYKGLSPSLVKAAVSVGLNFWTYELCCHVIGVLEHR